MTDNCIKDVLALQEKSEEFNDMTVEQLLYSCIAGTGVKDTLWVLMNTNWDEYLPEAIAKFD